MQEVKQALEQFANLPTVDEPTSARGSELPDPDFTEVSTKWAAYCLRNLRGDLLTLGLNIAHSLSEFDRGLKYPQTLRD